MTNSAISDDQPVASAALRAVMGQYLTGVTIVTVTGPDQHSLWFDGKFL